MAGEPVVIRVPAETKAAWKAAAEKAGMSLGDYVTLGVETLRGAGTPATKRAAEARQVAGLIAKHQPAPTDPAKCARRIPAGSWCKRCQSIHTKGI